MGAGRPEKPRKLVLHVWIPEKTMKQIQDYMEENDYSRAGDVVARAMQELSMRDRRRGLRVRSEP